MERSTAQSFSTQRVATAPVLVVDLSQISGNATPTARKRRETQAEYALPMNG